jgi:hypothetical protein
MIHQIQELRGATRVSKTFDMESDTVAFTRPKPNA